MKALSASIFGVLTALVIAGGVYLGFRNYKKHQGFLEERRGLQAAVAELENEVKGWNGLPEDAARIQAELDSTKDTLAAQETRLEERLTARGSLSKTPKLVLADPQDADGWTVYPFSLVVEGRPSAVDSAMRALQDDLPLVRFNQLDAALRSSQRLKLEITGSVRFPLEN
jgi:hypothetical protein